MVTTMDPLIEPPDSGAMVCIPATAPSADDATESWLNLGRDLAHWRMTAGMRQADLARYLRCSRSTIAAVEAGLRRQPRPFWLGADSLLSANGLLLHAFERVEAIAHTPLSSTGRGTRPHTVVQPADVRTIACWGRRETQALRKALRLTVREFARRLGLSASTVSSWESERAPKKPLLSSEDILDQALSVAGPAEQTRFWRLLGVID